RDAVALVRREQARRLRPALGVARRLLREVPLPLLADEPVPPVLVGPVPRRRQARPAPADPRLAELDDEPLGAGRAPTEAVERERREVERRHLPRDAFCEVLPDRG